MKLPFSCRKKFILSALKQHLGLFGIWLVFVLFGSAFAYLGSNIKENKYGFIFFGFAFIILPTAFMRYTLPSSILHYYEQELTKKYGSYTSAKVTNKKIANYSHTTSTFDGGKLKNIKEFLYVVEFQFSYNNQVYESECFFEHKATFEAISLETKLPIQFLKTNPKKITLRRRKLANQLGIKPNLCN
ncbi:hypothetical protein KO494_08020 [Lacinutrix sp. C3R15]|uniref:hypothetical protein n=1 Tax=Flavobacteriaceae TaxID=49546 RepID=UPI001C08ECDC|nr:MULTISPECIES: hypothetical protein [Flavobacteriaceae]MBU2939484.1 hypothetical protein [Lacinutrix sp. C3R15]MDO6622799.1 hypothetical protein [Oceanihabitans sp. 1_MG-2023]